MFLDDIIKKLENFPAEEITKRAVLKNEQFAVDLNKDQMLDGENAKDQPITPDYAESTKIRKRKRGLPTNKVTFLESGEFQGKMFLEDDQEGFDIDSKSNTTKFLVGRSGPDIFGLGDKSKDKLNKKILPDLQREVKLYLTK